MNELEWLDIFADNLVSYLRDFNMTQKDLAEESGLSEGAISNYIKKKQIPNLKAIINLSYALSISVSELIDFGDKIY